MTDPRVVPSSSDRAASDRHPVCLDWRAFPHLLDTVIATAHWPSLLALRATCKELRYKIDTELGRYIVLGPIGALQYGMSVSATNGHQHPAFAPWSPEWNVGVEGEEEDDDDGMDTFSEIVQFPQANTAYSLEVAAAAHCLDIAEVVPHCTLARFLELLGVRQPGVFRFMRGDYNADPLPHSSIATPGTRIVFSDCSRHVTDSLVQTYDLPTVPLPVDKFVSHVTVDPRRPHDILLHKWRFLARPTNMEVVLILKSSTDVAATRDELHAMARVIDTHDHLIGGVLHSVLGNIEHSLLLTVVGATDLPAYAFGLFHLPNPTQDEILQHLHDVAATKRPPNSKYRLRFLSLDEYRRTLTPEQFALATIEDARDIPLRFSTYR